MRGGAVRLNVLLETGVSFFFGGDPVVDGLGENIEVHFAGAKEGVVGFFWSEFSAEFAFSFGADVEGLELADFTGGEVVVAAALMGARRA